MALKPCLRFMLFQNLIYGGKLFEKLFHADKIAQIRMNINRSRHFTLLEKAAGSCRRLTLCLYKTGTDLRLGAETEVITAGQPVTSLMIVVEGVLGVFLPSAPRHARSPRPAAQVYIARMDIVSRRPSAKPTATDTCAAAITMIRTIPPNAFRENAGSLPFQMTMMARGRSL